MVVLGGVAVSCGRGTLVGEGVCGSEGRFDAGVLDRHRRERHPALGEGHGLWQPAGPATGDTLLLLYYSRA